MPTNISGSTSANSDLFDSINESNKTSSTRATDDSSNDTSDMFMQLLIAQLQNQDPTSPADPSTFVNQMSTMTQVENSINMTDAIQDMTTALQSSQSALQASSMVGQDVFVESDSTDMEANGSIRGAFQLENSASRVRYSVYDPDGNLVQTESMGAQTPGVHNFTWVGSGQPAGNYQVVIEADTGNGFEEIPGYLPQNVNTVTLGNGGSGLTLNTNNGSYTLDDVIQIG